MDSKTIILNRIAAARVTAQDAQRPEIARQPVDLDRFCEFLADYRAKVYRIATTDLNSTLNSLTEGKRLLVATDFPAEFEPSEPAHRDNNFSARELNDFDTTLTLCELGIEETGTLVLNGGLGQGRRAITLVPDHHICLIRSDQVVHSVAEAIARLDPVRPITLISGPSATSDIELVRVEGVHGPRRLDVVVIDDGMSRDACDPSKAV